MNKINILLVTALACGIFTSCNQNGKSSPESALVKQVISGRGTTTSYQYNSDNTVSSSSAGPGTKTTYKLTGNTIKEEIADSVRGRFITITIYLNSKGIADGPLTLLPQGTYSKIYTHDADGFITESRDYAKGELINASNMVVKDGNEVEAAVLDTSLKPMFKMYLEYYPDHVNSLSFRNYGMKFLGKDSKNLIKRVAQVTAAGDTVRVTNFRYHFDDKGRVSSKIMVDRSGMVVDSSSVSYY